MCHSVKLVLVIYIISRRPCVVFLVPRQSEPDFLWLSIPPVYKLGLYIYASTESILKKALQKAGFHKYPFEVLHMEEGTILKIDRYGFLSGSTFEVKESFRFGKWYNWYDELEEEYYSQQEELLLEMCSCYGVTEEDILLLLDYGYSTDEIEEMLCDSNLLLETINAIQSEEIFAQQ